MERLLTMAMFLFQWLLLFWLSFAINYIFNGVKFDEINHGIHLNVILTLAKFLSYVSYGFEAARSEGQYIF